MLSRDKARREESWGKLEKAFNNNEKVQGVIFNQVKGGFTVDLDGAVAFLPRSQVDIRPIRDVSPLMNQPQPFQILKMVNISALQFHQPDFTAQVDAALAATGFPAGRLELEITETVLMRDNPQTLAQLSALIARGVRIALDDFGTGYSALAYLARLPHHRIKLDRAFVRDLANPATAELIRAIIAARPGPRRRHHRRGCRDPQAGRARPAHGLHPRPGFRHRPAGRRPGGDLRFRRGANRLIWTPRFNCHA